MKNTFLIISALLFASGLFAQETLFGDIDGEDIGGFGSPFIEIGSISGQTGSYVGGGGALVLGQAFIGGYGLGTTYPEVDIDGVRYEIRFRHSGLWLGYAPLQHKVVHPYISLRFGWGKSQLRRGDASEFSERNSVLTPELGMEVNLFHFIKMALSGSYRWVNGVDNLQGLDNGDFSSFMGVVTFRIGGFGNYDYWD